MIIFAASGLGKSHLASMSDDIVDGDHVAFSPMARAEMRRHGAPLTGTWWTGPDAAQIHRMTSDILLDYITLEPDKLVLFNTDLRIFLTRADQRGFTPRDFAVAYVDPDGAVFKLQAERTAARDHAHRPTLQQMRENQNRLVEVAEEMDISILTGTSLEDIVAAFVTLTRDGDLQPT